MTLEVLLGEINSEASKVRLIESAWVGQTRHSVFVLMPNPSNHSAEVYLLPTFQSGLQKSDMEGVRVVMTAAEGHQTQIVSLDRDGQATVFHLDLAKTAYKIDFQLPAA